MAATCIFVGYDRVQREENRRELTRRHMAALLGISYDEFKERFAWTNLHDGPAPPRKSAALDRDLADLLLAGVLRDYDRAILVGGDVARAFRCARREPNKWAPLDARPELLVAWMHHTSRRNWFKRTYWDKGHGPWADESREFVGDLKKQC